MDVGELERDAVRHHPLFAAGVDEQQILLPVVEEAEIALRIVAVAGWRRGGAAVGATGASGGGRRCDALRRARHHRGPRAGLAVRLHEGADAVERLGGDAPAVAQPAGELAVVDGAAAEGRFRKAGVAAIVGDFLQQFLRVHRGTPWRFLRSRAGGFSRVSIGAGPIESEPILREWVNHKSSH